MQIIREHHVSSSYGGTLKVKGGTLLFGDMFFQISNISVVSIAKIVTPFPTKSLFFLFAGLFAFLIEYGESQTRPWGYQFNWEGTGGIGVLLVVIFLIWFWVWLSSGEKIGLYIVTNAGVVGSILIVSKDVEFLIQAALTLRNIMDSEDETILANISIDRREIKVEAVAGSNIIFDSPIYGSVTNSIDVLDKAKI